MQVIEFIKQNGFTALTEQFGISVKFVDDLVMLNYNQIESPKTHPLVIECRSLILEKDTLSVVSRSFDRFFNYGEALNVMPVIDWNIAKAFQKVDGSLIKIYCHNDKWFISTKGTTYGESDCMGHGVTFAELVYKSLDCANDDEFQTLMDESRMCTLSTYIFEVTSFENRVVKHYTGYNLHFLASRDNETGVYTTDEERCWLLHLKEEGYGIGVHIVHPEAFTFGTVEDCQRTAMHLKDLDEGYVIYQNDVPVAKIKSPAYVAVHHIRGEGLNPKRIMQLVLTNEHEEYLQYFPEDRVMIQPYIEAKALLDLEIISVYSGVRGIADQKEFAMAVGKYKFKAALFAARIGERDPLQCFNDQRETYKMEILKGYMV